MSSYPEGRVRVIGVKFKSDLVLWRGIDAVKSRKDSDAIYTVHEDYHVHVTVEDWLYETGITFKHVVPAGFHTDLASVPRFGRWFVGRVGPHLEASIIHDWLYVAWQIEGIEPTKDMKKYADDVFNIAMAESKVQWLRRQTMYHAVKYGGKRVFFT